MKQFLVVSVLGEDRPGTLDRIAGEILDCGANISETRMSVLGREFAMVLLLEGKWDALARLEAAFERIRSKNNVQIGVRRTGERPAERDRLPYSVDAVCLDQPGIIFRLTAFFSRQDIGISEMATRCYPATHTGAPMCSVQMTVNVPAEIHIASLREEFMDFCDQANLDAVLEPIKQ